MTAALIVLGAIAGIAALMWLIDRPEGLPPGDEPWRWEQTNARRRTSRRP